MSPDEEIAFLRREVAGYQRIAKEAAEMEGGTVVLLAVEGGAELRIYGPTPDREQAFAETVARWFKVVGVTTDCLLIKGARDQLATIATKLAEIEKVLTPKVPS